MLKKAEQTKKFIIEKAAPIFNQKGYGNTSLSDICRITGLSKGSVYGNFKSKNELALASFNYVLHNNIFPLADRVQAVKSPKDQLNLIFDYYRTYYKETDLLGGCPVLNIGIDANHQNPELRKRVLQVIDKLISNIELIIINGQEEKVFNEQVNAGSYAKRIYSMIEGCVFTGMMRKDEEHISEMMDYLVEMTKRELFI